MTDLDLTTRRLRDIVRSAVDTFVTHQGTGAGMNAAELLLVQELGALATKALHARMAANFVVVDAGLSPPRPPAADGLPEEERAIAGKLIRTILAAGYAIRVWEGEGWACAQSADFDTVWAALASTDQDVLHVYDNGERRGFVHLIYGNGADLLSDHTDNTLINALVTAAEQGPWIILHTTTVRADMQQDPRCDECGAPLPEAGDGYDGKCAECADIEENARGDA